MNNIAIHPTPSPVAAQQCDEGEHAGSPLHEPLPDFCHSPQHDADEDTRYLIDSINMKAEVCWDNAEKSIIRYTFSGVWNWDDFYQILDERVTIIPRRGEDVIVDFRAISFAPSDAILHLKRAAKMAENAEGMIVVISNSATIVTLYHAFVTMYKTLGKRLRIVNNDQEAYAVLGKRER